MKVTSEAGRKLFKSMGFKKEAVDGWTEAELVKKLNLLPQKYEKGKNDPKDKESKKLLKDILSAVEDDEEEVSLDKKKGKEDKKGGKTKKGKKTKDEDEEDDESEEEDVEDEDEDSDDDEDESDEDEDEDSDDEEEETVSKKKSKKGKSKDKGKKGKKKGFVGSAGGAGKPGITQTIKDTIVKHDNKKKPLTKEKMLDILERKFPDRERKSMGVTVYSQLAYKLPLAGWPIKNLGGSDGFYMTGNPPKGSKPKDDDDDKPKKGKKKKKGKK